MPAAKGSARTPLGPIPKIVAYPSLLRWFHALRSDQLAKIVAYLSLLRWSQALRSDQCFSPGVIELEDGPGWSKKAVVVKGDER